MQPKLELGSSIVIRGEITAQEDVTISGRVEGSVRVDGHRVIVSPGAHLVADVHAREIVVSGAVKGALAAKDRIELRAGAEVEGDLTTPALGMADGAGFKGRVEMERRKPGLQLAS
jgi:cytoskeletal protein CcmA (bactofilin family)